MICIAWDIETCPRPLSAFSETQQVRYEKEYARQRERNPEMVDEELSRLVRSIHPHLGWICCISAVSGTLDRRVNDPVSWTAAGEDEEAQLLRAFWAAVAGFPRSVTWVTFNGKRFDVPFILARSARHRVSPTRADMTNTYPYKDRPHTDLSNLWLVSYGLADLCEHLGVDSPKGGFDGSDVACAVHDGRIQEVKDYCERDAIATLGCAQAAETVLTLR
jgi:3'-5' exonuclease